MNSRLVIGMYVALLLGPIVIIMGIVEYTQTKKLLADGRDVPGTVSDTRTVSGRRGATTYHLTVTYKPIEEGPRYEKDFSVSRLIYESASVGSQIPVRVSPKDPTVSMIGDNASPDTEMIAIGSGVFLFGVAVFWWRRRKLVEVGEHANDASREKASRSGG